MKDLPTKNEIKDYLKIHRKKFPRATVANHIGVSKSTLDNCLSKEPMSDAMRYEIAIFTGMIKDDEKTAEIQIPDTILNLRIKDEDFNLWQEAALNKQQTVTDWLIHTGNAEASRMLKDQFNITPNITPLIQEDVSNLTDLPLRGAVACGEPVEAVRHGETIRVEGIWDEYHEVGEANGRSMEPTVMDGDRFIYETKDKFSPKHNKVCVIQDAQGMSLKRYNRETNQYESDNPDYNDFTPIGDVTLVGYLVQTITD